MLWQQVYVAIINISISIHQKKALSVFCHWSLLVIASFVDAKVTVRIISMHFFLLNKNYIDLLTGLTITV